MHVLHVIVVVLTIWVTIISSQDTDTALYSRLYTSLENWPCVRLLNATSTIGCQAFTTGSGVLFEVKTQNDINVFINTNSFNDAYAIVLPYNLLTLDNIRNLKATGRLTGIIVLTGSNLLLTNSSTSPDSSCPNCAFGLYANDAETYIWNPQATGLLDEAFDIPLYGLNPTSNESTQVYNTIQSALNYNKERSYQQYPLQAVDFDLKMWAAINSQTCLRRGWCQPVGGLSVFSTPSQSISVDDNKPIIVLTASMDSRSLFHDLTLGVDTSISGMVTLLSVADALSRAPTSPANFDKHILYTLFTAESWGFAGSQRFVQDISQPFVCTNQSRSSPCPYANAPCTQPCVQDLNFKLINVNNIETIVEFGSISNNDNTIWAHVDDSSLSDPLVQSLQSQSNINSGSSNNSSSLVIQAANSDGVQRRLPPSSVMSFLKQKRSIKAAVLTGYQKQMNGYYNSDMDDDLDLNLMTQKLCTLANITAQTVYQQALTSSNNSNIISANCSLVYELLDCLTFNFSCPYMQNYFNVSGIDRISHYSSVYSQSNPQPQYIPRFVFSYLSGVTGTTRLDQQQQQQPVKCNRIQDCQASEYCIRQKCVKTLTSYHPAYGTGLHYDETTGVLSVVDSTKGTYTESTWDSPSLRLFLVPSREQQHIELVIGIIWFVTNVIMVIFAKRYARSRFKLD
ncbi:Nicastrin-domain-containing protein [Halteromyces radiatus]|uniref:Nicastrin-domain-containing protein n=1 Tax=Halteromyces radiatus TaxID=101107 RepID=UPI0022200801|nr:Nicastrin-domain-containing protein [Halteromyces radiatus]KAI8096192.1 Nicastrin-domain-containing protein [Halteromyces radiatus]